ncbi:hypothetical protein A3B42_01170 [Candidatus Daviesbacteria bacterium RIFCSPLOWO2_01_FULL_38_10]|uniref:POTRA domain-containing protein n=1 Tax=Candidatus Daviesbacteria bacterium GW2011_GWF2_38_6 TaxID=1618432 RepID=A0A0G0MXW3_9BACT|nr:MAG: hypothetical protein US80_C0002G0016 [Candidatus Daviesbacteria bacterium GW2011_GWA2_38_17]KKQ78489.1 MAG: hypothetical protein US99_C0020G0014 [Candidatus Daviesbacteria bacterium GW2011_GWF2_38_6]OGE26558.1 MAG: hypothetical protein A3D02_04715 [Candidatus Daviesbacteria bacterium RIFCSPHIGHO2_02_FULL_39_41]OGE27439.1 MAG: hypothetical protein A2772_01635 [Candidatus Daviesbacteria bacterium RIFCSPHIGHO2_01_FULL_38_8b]OGE37153.1 MAG: hypothetical protein A3B42_01170 [Candidatus Davie
MGKKIKLTILIAGITSLLLIGIYLIFFSKFFIVKSVEVESNLTCVDKEGLLNAVAISGSNFFLIRSLAIEEKLKSKFTCVKSAGIIKKLPNKIFLEVRNREPQARIFIVTNQESTPSAETAIDSFLVDEEGMLFSGNQESSLKIYSENKNEDFKKIIAVLNKIKFFGIEIMEVIVVEDILLINSVPKINFSLDKASDMQLASLQLILNKAKINGEAVEFIDLRFDKPVVRFAPKKK